ncbi:LysR family transcriptional regulator [Hahella sp. KA22]|uniref:LysR substrate-binding domain-containing protein n=1 Tax=Hahella sp. KA22 TaxID=1628392 RepID=UPI000FDD34F1|nr:LysR substrate-binding domain-containing protein [Hahella sp. KA22]AZZ92082.1 LysR family transcriptional regulator [Hahella sp. KA22]QAY55453.1 LysR family transcriptional regulator [Hahella sp. KA22]
MNYLPTDLLQTFVAVADYGGFTQAGDALGRSQPAISLQIRRLEELVGTTLLVRNNKALAPTPEGLILLQYARDILALNKEAMIKLSQPELAGCLRLGIPNEFASSLPEVLGKFSQAHPNVTLEVTCDLSSNLVERYRSKELDLVFALHTSLRTISPEEGWMEDLVWATSIHHTCHTRHPVPLIVAPRGCVYRHRIIEALDSMSIPWRIVYTCASFSGIRAGVLAGLGVTVLGKSIVPEGLRVVESSDYLPALPGVQMRLLYNREQTSPAVAGFVQFISRTAPVTGDGLSLDGLRAG